MKHFEMINDCGESHSEGWILARAVADLDGRAGGDGASDWAEDADDGRLISLVDRRAGPDERGDANDEYERVSQQVQAKARADRALGLPSGDVSGRW